MNIGLVLSGGMAKGAYQIGALRALSDFIPLEDIKYISCASVGVLNGYAYATNRLDQAEAMWKGVCQKNARVGIGQILRSNLLQHDIARICNADDVLTPKFYASLLDMTHKKIVYRNLASASPENLPLYLKASVAMPVYNCAINVDEISYYDGALIDNIPVFPLLRHRLDYIVCMYFDDVCYKFENTYFDNKVIKITFPCASIVRQSLLLRRDGVDSMIRDGYERATDILNSVLVNGYEDLDYISNVIECKNRNETRSLRITGDVLVTNLNRVIQRFTKKRIVQ